MKINLNLKIFTAFSVIYILSIACMITMMYFYTSYRFVHYVDNKVVENLDKLVRELSVSFKKDSNWNKFRDVPTAWQKTLADSLPESHFIPDFPPEPPKNAERIGIDGGDGSNPPPSMHHDPPLPSFDDGAHFHPPKPHDIKEFIFKRLSLWDSDGEFVAGNSFAPEMNIYRDIIINGDVAGRIGLQKSRRPLFPQEIHFLNQQLKMFIFIGIGTLIFCALISYLLANHLLAPVKQLMEGTHAVANLKFDTRIQVFSTDELGQLAQDFNLMAKTLERYEQMQRQWIADIAHELRTPLSIMRGEIEAIQDGIRKYNPAVLNSLHDEVMTLAKTVGDLHELSLADSGALTFVQKPIALEKVLKDTLNQFQTRFFQHRITVENRLDDRSNVLVQGDRRRLRQLFTNLFENTIRHGNSPGRLTVSQECKDNQLIIVIEDSGPGVPQESLERIFDRLYRVDFARSHSREGSGLGLSICKMIVTAHQGLIRAENSSGGGLRIIIALPIITDKRFTQKTLPSGGGGIKAK